MEIRRVKNLEELNLVSQEYYYKNVSDVEVLNNNEIKMVRTLGKYEAKPNLLEFRIRLKIYSFQIGFFKKFHKILNFMHLNNNFWKKAWRVIDQKKFAEDEMKLAAQGATQGIVRILFNNQNNLNVSSEIETCANLITVRSSGENHAQKFDAYLALAKQTRSRRKAYLKQAQNQLEKANELNSKDKKAKYKQLMNAYKQFIAEDKVDKKKDPTLILASINVCEGYLKLYPKDTRIAHRLARLKLKNERIGR